jgi:hypothetical protein
MIKNITVTFTAFCVAWAIYSVFLDEIFFSIDYGKSDGIFSSFFSYLLVMIIGYGIFAIPICIIFRYVSSSLNDKLQYTIIMSIILGALIGNVIGKNYYSFYIGNFRELKGYILFISSITTTELVFYYFKKKKI